jgi:multidrug transporter EmrE-like cation transporter
MDISMAIGAAVFFTIGGIFMKMSQGLSQILPTILIYVCCGIGATFQAMAMQKSEGLGMTYIFVIGLEVILTLGFGMILFQESYSSLKLIGIGLITVGIIFLRSGST